MSPVSLSCRACFLMCDKVDLCYQNSTSCVWCQQEKESGARYPACFVSVSAMRGYVHGDPVSRLPARCGRLNLSLLARGKSQVRCVIFLPYRSGFSEPFLLQSPGNKEQTWGKDKDL